MQKEDCVEHMCVSAGCMGRCNLMDSGNGRGLQCYYCSRRRVSADEFFDVIQVIYHGLRIYHECTVRELMFG
jgi:hypothetical protein